MKRQTIKKSSAKQSLLENLIYINTVSRIAINGNDDDRKKALLLIRNRLGCF